MNEALKTPDSSESITLRELILKYTRYWYLFLLSIVVCYGLSRLYLRYSKTVYHTVGTIIIKEDRSNNRTLDLSNISSFRSFFSSYNGGRINNEIAIFKSNRIISQAIDALTLNIAYESVGSVKTTGLYRVKPIEVKFLNFNGTYKTKGIPKLFFEILSKNEYRLFNDAKTISEVHVFGEKVSLKYGDIIVIPDYEDPSQFEKNIGLIISVEYRATEKLSNSFKRNLSVENDIENSNVVTISMKSVNPEQSEDFINELIEQYNMDAIADKGMVAKKTSEFIASRLRIIEEELDSVENDKVLFKSGNRIVDMASEAEISLTGAYEYEKKQVDVQTKIELAKSVIEYIESSEEQELLPENIGLDNNEVGTTIQAYNQLVLQRSKFLKASTPKNPVVLNLDNQIEDLKTNIVSELKGTQSALEIELKNINATGFKLDSEIREIPGKEKVYRGIERQQNIKEQLYLFLLQQREEASLSLAATSTKAKIVDYVYTSKTPVSPNRRYILLLSLFAGVVIPFVFLYLKFLLNYKVANRTDVERILSKLTFLGELPKIGKGDDELISTNDRSILAESFRILRTNLQYFFIDKLDKSDKARNIFVTSTIKGEGKTFVAFNLALTLALTGKKVVLVGADIRNPQLQRYLPEESRSRKGLTEFIIDDDLTVNDLAAKSVYNDNLCIVLSGVIPPNPAELLMRQRTMDFFEELKDIYDYIIVDTAPSMLVTDTVLINHLADVTLYIVRAGYTDKKLLEFPKDAVNDGRLSNVAMVLNNVDMNNFGYGNKYGYSYGSEKRSLLKRLFRW